jgi:hypothetical protein
LGAHLDLRHVDGQRLDGVYHLRLLHELDPELRRLVHRDP